MSVFCKPLQNFRFRLSQQSSWTLSHRVRKSLLYKNTENFVLFQCNTCIDLTMPRRECTLPSVWVMVLDISEFTKLLKYVIWCNAEECITDILITPFSVAFRNCDKELNMLIDSWPQQKCFLKLGIFLTRKVLRIYRFLRYYNPYMLKAHFIRRSE